MLGCGVLKRLLVWVRSVQVACESGERANRIIFKVYA